MRDYLLGTIVQTSDKKGFICKNVEPLLIETEGMLLHTAYFVDKSITDAQEGLAILEVIKTITAKNGKAVHYMRPLIMQAGVVESPAIRMLLASESMPRVDFFKLLAYGTGGLLGQDSQFWLDIFKNVYPKYLDGKHVRLDLETWSSIRKRCEAWLIAMIDHRFTPGKDLQYKLTDFIESLPGYPHYQLVNPGSTFTTGDTADVEDVFGHRRTVEIIPLLNGKTGSCYNVVFSVRTAANNIIYVTQLRRGFGTRSNRAACLRSKPNNNTQIASEA